MSNSIGIGKRKMSHSIGIGESKMIFLSGDWRSDLNCPQKSGYYVRSRACALRAS